MTAARNIQRLVYLVGFLDLAAVMLIIPLFVVHLRRIGMSPLVSGAVRSFYGILQLVSCPLVGRSSDKYGRRPLLLLGLALSAMGYFVLGASDSLLVMVVSRIITGIFKHTITLCKAVLADVTAPEDRQGVLGTFNGAVGLAFIVGPIIGVLCFVFLPGVLPAPQPGRAKPRHTPVPRESDKEESSEEHLVIGQDKGHLSQEQIDIGQLEQKDSRQFVQEEQSLEDQPVPDQLDTKLTEAETLKQVFHFIKDIDWQVFGDVFMIDFFLTFAAFAYRSSFVLSVDEMFDASPKTIGYIISFQGIVGAVAGFFTGKLSQFYNDSQLELFHSSVLQVLSLLGLTLAPTVSSILILLVPLCISDTIIRTSVSTIVINRCDPLKIGSVTGFGQSIPAVAGMTTPILTGLAQEITVYGPGIMASLSAGIGATLAGYMESYRAWRMGCIQVPYKEGDNKFNSLNQKPLTSTIALLLRSRKLLKQNSPTTVLDNVQSSSQHLPIHFKLGTVPYNIRNKKDSEESLNQG
ncbi:major facilitator superfamily domain-containing protein 9 isoform X3 [Cherax quadricarinatus]|uniref:major facilitator superfamily domain-containing protein 9 isoform X3 n=1 Tax=Cherax quadricarinatus TaxID=27406 RepID=UPI00387E3318